MANIDLSILTGMSRELGFGSLTKKDLDKATVEVGDLVKFENGEWTVVNGDLSSEEDIEGVSFRIKIGDIAARVPFKTLMFTKGVIADADAGPAKEVYKLLAGTADKEKGTEVALPTGFKVLNVENRKNRAGQFTYPAYMYQAFQDAVAVGKTEEGEDFETMSVYRNRDLMRSLPGGALTPQAQAIKAEMKDTKFNDEFASKALKISLTV